MRDDRPSTTAEVVALWRAIEQGYPEGNRILQDPYAAGLLSWKTRPFIGWQKAPSLPQLWDASAGGGTLIYTVLRHRWMEEALARHAETRPPPEVLILGAGYDMRAFRLPELQNIRVVEVDHPATGGRKARGVGQLGLEDRVERVAVDFARESVQEALVRIRFAHDGWFFWEGVSMYLPEAAVRATLTALAGWGCAGVIDFYAPPFMGGALGLYHRFLPGVASLVGEKVDFRLPMDQAEGFLRECGFAIVEIVKSKAMIPAHARSRWGMYPNPHGYGVRVKSLHHPKA